MYNRKKNRALSRNEWRIISDKAIVNTRKHIVIENQENGYGFFHYESKINDYVKTARDFYNSIADDVGHSLALRHAFIKHIGIGRCHECAEYLCYELAISLKALNINATLSIFEYVECDHMAVDVVLWLAGESGPSTWRIDAWDPSIIDITLNPDGTINNEDLLSEYGYKVYYKYSVKSMEVDNPSTSLFTFRKPVPGTPREATPEDDRIDKHQWLYSDHTIKEARKKRLLAPDKENQENRAQMGPTQPTGHPQKKRRLGT